VIKRPGERPKGFDEVAGRAFDPVAVKETRAARQGKILS
jgi:hypothetical protein